jgi:hypothetical protein
MTKIPKAVAVAEDVKKPKASPAQQISRVMKLLQHLQPEKATVDLFDELCGWCAGLPPGHRPEALLTMMASAFRRPVDEVVQILKAADSRRVHFDQLVPKAGWIRDYVEWTRQTEPPTVFHFFVAATVIGSTLGRNVFFDKGAYSVFPNLCVMIIAPSGKCRKTSCCTMGTKVFVKSGGTLTGGDKPTPEALIEALTGTTSAVGLIYAPELAVFLGKQKYQEGMIPLLTALFDCPDEWTSKTIGHGDKTLMNVALSAIMCSTMDWLQTGIPKDAFGGGFMSRFLFVVQEDTDRTFPLPPARNKDVGKTLSSRLTKLRNHKGQFVMSRSAEQWYDGWYRSRPRQHGEKQFAGYYERKPDHLLRLAMILHVAEAEDFVLEAKDLHRSLRILDWLEEWLPGTFEEMTSTASGEDQQRILRQLKSAGGAMEHSVLLRRNSSKMNAEQFKRSMSTLREAQLVEWDGTTRTYYLSALGWA